MSIQPLLYRQYTALIARWPVDPLRPTLNFSDALRARVTHYFGADSTPSPSKNTGAATAKPAAEKFDVGAVKREINVLAALLEDRFTNKYPISETMLRPKGNPEYYEKLMKELEAAPERSWLGSKINAWKGWIRMR